MTRFAPKCRPISSKGPKSCKQLSWRKSTRPKPPGFALDASTLRNPMLRKPSQNLPKRLRNSQNDYKLQDSEKFNYGNSPSMTTPPTNRGGSRPGSGRKPTGRTGTTSSISMPPAVWTMLDAIRGELTRSAWIAGKIKNALK